MRFGLRYLGKVIPIGPVSTVIGRSVTCKVVLDDDAVSRRHARLRMEGEGLIVEDLESANGVYVNGQRVEGWRMVGLGDQIQIGDQQLDVVAAEQAPSTRRRARRHRSERPQGSSAVDMLWDDDDEEDDVGAPTRKSDRFEMLLSAVELALAEGHPEAAAKFVTSALERLLAQTRRTGHLDDEDAMPPAKMALRVALETSQPDLIDWVLSLYATAGSAMPAKLLSSLKTTVEQLGPTELEQLEPYLKTLREKSAKLGAAGRRTLTTLEQLQGLLRPRG